MSDTEQGRRCPHCREVVEANSKFCKHCGAAAPRVARSRKEARRRNASRLNRSVWAVAIVFGGTILELIVLFFLFEGEKDNAGKNIAHLLGGGLVGMTALLVLGGDSIRRSFAGVGEFREWILGVAGGLFSLVIALIWVRLLAALASGLGNDPEPIQKSAAMFLSIVVIAPLLEEWLCRGVLWEALRGLASRKTCIFASAALFALLHALEALFLSLPHRFVAGLVFGWLRDRSGSLVPGIIGHAVLNAIAFMLM